MYKLLIVDDEPLVQAGIKSMLNWEKYGIEIVGTASNGKQALDIVEQTRPDIVITDIRMPVMSGLELIANCRKMYGEDDIVFIVLTSYEEFSLVKEAITYQVMEYLVKIELTAGVLEKTIERALAKLKKKAPEDTGILVNDLRDKFLFRLINNLFDTEEDFETQLKTVKVNFDYSLFTCCCGEIVAEGRQYIAENPQQYSNEFQPEEERQITLYSTAMQMLMELVPKYAVSYCLTLDVTHFAIIICHNDDACDPMQVMENVSEALKKYYNVSLHCGIGKPVDMPIHLHRSFKSAKKVFLTCDEDNSIRCFVDKPDSFYNSSKYKMTKKIKTYIKENVRSHINQNEVAEVFAISPTYISRLFSDYNDMGFSEYVNYCKIKEAKKLLASGEYKVYEVADLLGFESSFYFSKVFKKVEGISPTDFMNDI